MAKSAKKFWKLGRDEFNTRFLDVNANDELIIREGHFQYNVPQLLKRYGTPLEIICPSIIEERLRRLNAVFSDRIRRSNYKGRFLYHYPLKVNQSRDVVLPLISEGANAETSSVNELWLVKKLYEEGRRAPKLRVLCNGPKTQAYLRLIDQLDGCGLIVTPIIEHESEIAAFKSYGGEVGLRANMDIRIKSHWDKKFNHFGLQEERILKIGKIRNLAVLSYHISSQVDNLDGLVVPIRRAMSLYAKLKPTNPKLDTVDIGGGAGIPYEKKRYYNIDAAIGRIVRTFKREAMRHGVREPNIICEWGRYIAAPAQITCFETITEKIVTNGSTKRWYVVDGSFMNDLSDTLLVHQRWHVIPAAEMSSRPLQKVWLAGSSCDSDDKYTAGGSSVLLPKFDDERKQHLAVLDTGAYQAPLASHHCLLGNPARVVLRSGDVRLTRRRETPEELGRRFGW